MIDVELLSRLLELLGRGLAAALLLFVFAAIFLAVLGPWIGIFGRSGGEAGSERDERP